MKLYVSLQRSKSRYGIETVGKSVGFFYTLILNVKPLACWCAQAAMPARICNEILNNAYKPFLFNVQKTSLQ